MAPRFLGGNTAAGLEEIAANQVCFYRVRVGAEIARQADLVSLVQDERLQIFFDPMPMSRLAALLERATLHVGLDSGVLHLAMALGKPTVSLFRESVGRPGWVPRGSKHRALIKKCPCNETGQNKCFESRPLCLSLITPQEVAHTVLAALEEKL